MEEWNERRFEKSAENEDKQVNDFDIYKYDLNVVYQRQSACYTTTNIWIIFVFKRSTNLS